MKRTRVPSVFVKQEATLHKIFLAIFLHTADPAAATTAGQPPKHSQGRI